MDEELVFCRYEQLSFAADEFYQHESWGRVHKRAPLHTVGGTILLAEEDIPLPAPVEPPDS